MLIFNCISCKKIVERKHHFSYDNIYCSNKCQKDFEGKRKVTLWVEGKIQPTKSIVARYLKEYKGYKCESCNIDEWNNIPITLEIDHIDGNSSNNDPSNFRYLCPNCHSQTSSYKGANRGRGRPKDTKNNTIQRSYS
jgi:5-methylcytosine-specific restriction endonuclease McrA